jgi:hypothetical protein
MKRQRLVVATLVGFGILAAALITTLAPVPAHAGSTNPNFGKADDYGSDRFRAINTCMIEATTNKAPADHSGLGLKTCMDRLGFEPCNNCQIYGNRGPKCIKDAEGFFHSWCWEAAK